MTTVTKYLQGLLNETHDLETFLNALTHVSAHALMRQDGDLLCGITVRRHKRAGTVASNSPLAQEMDEVQYAYAEGPCLTACREQTTVSVPDLESESRWPDYVADVKGRGVRSILAVPFAVDAEDTAALNLYSMRSHAFDEKAIEQADYYAQQASLYLNLAIRMARHRDNEENMKLAMGARTVIDLAVGIIMGQNRCSQAQAVGILKSASSSRNIKLRAVAQAVIDSTTNEPVDTHFEP